MFCVSPALTALAGCLLYQAAQKYSSAIEFAVKDQPETVAKFGIPGQARYYFNVVLFLMRQGAKYDIAF